MRIIRLRVDGLTAANAAAFEAAAASVGATRTDTWKGRAAVTIDDGTSSGDLVARLAFAGFPSRLEKNSAVVHIGGMTCRSCELTIEEGFRRAHGVTSVSADAAKGIATITYEGERPDDASLQATLEGHAYEVGAESTTERPSLGRVLALFGAILLLAALLGRLGALDAGYQLGNGSNFLQAVVIGLLAGSTSCVAVAGGLLLSSAKAFKRRYGSGAMTPVAAFVGGRVASYALLGGVLGAVGAFVDPPPAVTGALIIAAALYMLVMGLDMLGIAPRWLRGMMPRMPKAIGGRMLSAGGKDAHPAMPALLGAATFFLPCGFTQALQLYALSSGSFAAGAAVLGGFAIGTAPVLTALGWASTTLKGKAGALFFQFSGALVVVLGVWNVQNGLTVIGHPLRMPSFPATATAAQAAPDPNVAVKDGVQVIDVALTAASPFYAPANSFVVKAGMPVRMTLRGVGTGCRSIFQIPEFGVKTALNKSVNVVEFTPTKPVTATFSCSMGMFPGRITVVKS